MYTRPPQSELIFVVTLEGPAQAFFGHRRPKFGKFRWLCDNQVSLETLADGQKRWVISGDLPRRLAVL
jgi:hypothetical protein